MSSNTTYVGRFAPSPTGPLHFGSLVAALASYLDAKANNGQWLLRIEDLDPPRESPEAPNVIIKQLQYFGFEWDGDILFQSSRLPAYQAAIKKLTSDQHCFDCACSRKSFDKIYPGTCREGQPSEGLTAIRLKLANKDIKINDQIQGLQSWDLMQEVGDFIIKRKDGLFAYQLAVVVDDDFQGVSHIIRGIDLLDSTPKQIYLAECLSLREVKYAHFPVITGEDGHKLSKQSHAAPIMTENREQVFNLALKALGQDPVAEGTGIEMLRQATKNWQIKLIPERPDLALADL